MDKNPPPVVFGLDDAAVFRGKAVRVMGRLQLEGASGQISYRYQFSDGAGAPVLIEQLEDQYAWLRPFPAAAEPRTAGNTVTVAEERYTLVRVRRLKVSEAIGQVPGAAPNMALLLSGVFEGPAGILLRELVPGSDRQLYYLMKLLPAGELVTSAEHAAARDAERQAAGEREDD